MKTIRFIINYEDLEPRLLYRTKIYFANIGAAYKTKVKKVQLVDEADGIGKVPGGVADWYKRSKAKDTPQE